MKRLDLIKQIIAFKMVQRGETGQFGVLSVTYFYIFYDIIQKN